MIRSLIPWTQLTRFGIPELQIARRPLTIGAVTLTIGQPLDVNLLSADIRTRRLRQFYEQRLLEPIIAPKGSRQAHRQPPMPQSVVSPTTTGVRQSVPLTFSSPISAAVIPFVDIPVSDVAHAPTRTNYTPPRPTKPAVGKKGAR